jgi:hypothetical protein
MNSNYLDSEPMHGCQIITKIRKTFGVYFGPTTVHLRAQSFYDVDLMGKAVKKATKMLSIPKKPQKNKICYLILWV